MHKRLKVGTRPSILAMAQVEEIKRLLPEVILDVVAIATKGDKDKITPLTERENTDFFTHEIEEALLKEEIDFAVHSAKDLEADLPSELTIAAITKSISRPDSLVARDNHTLDTLPKGSRIGTSSNNRRRGILRYRSDLIVKDIRGNVDERLKQLYRGHFEAVIVAHAALIRLGLSKRVSQVIPQSIIVPHPLQGRLAIQVKRKREDVIEIVGRINES